MRLCSYAPPPLLFCSVFLGSVKRSEWKIIRQIGDPTPLADHSSHEMRAHGVGTPTISGRLVPGALTFRKVAGFAASTIFFKQEGAQRQGIERAARIGLDRILRPARPRSPARGEVRAQENRHASQGAKGLDHIIKKALLRKRTVPSWSQTPPRGPRRSNNKVRAKLEIRGGPWDTTTPAPRAGRSQSLEKYATTCRPPGHRSCLRPRSDNGDRHASTTTPLKQANG